MSGPEFDKFDLEGLSLEEVEPAKPVVEKPLEDQSLDQPVDQPVEEIVLADAIPAEPEQVAESGDQLVDEPELMNMSESADPSEGQMVCPKCELEQIKAEQCSGCGVYIAKALAQIGQSKIEITAVKF